MEGPAELRRDDIITERYWNYQDDFRVVSVFENGKLFHTYVQQFIRVPSRKSGGHWKQFNRAASPRIYDQVMQAFDHRR